ncbi:MAG: ATP phosphoribosyltransferase regulatory subunit, partial [Hyphomonadaceae bacterium]
AFGASPGLVQLQEINVVLTALGVGDAAALIDTSIVRGLEYYTGPVFEAELMMETVDEAGNTIRFGSVGGGGRYDDLVSRFRGEKIPATGFSIGVSRLAAALAAARREGGEAEGPVVVLVMDKERVGDSFAMAQELRAAGLRAEVYLGGGGMKAQLKYADKRGAPVAVIQGSDEAARGVVTLKDLKLGAALSKNVADNKEWREGRPAQQESARADLAAAVKAMLGRP